MEKIDHLYLGSVISDLAGVPVRIYEHGERKFYRSLVALPADPLAPFLREALSLHSHIGCFVTPYFHSYGVVNSGAVQIVIGPSSQIESADRSLRELAFRCNVPQESVAAFIAGMKRIAPMPFTRIVPIMCMLNYVLNGEKSGLSDVCFCNAAQQSIAQERETARAAHDLHVGAEGEEPPRSVRNTLMSERTLIDLVSRGDLSALHAWAAGASSVQTGGFAADRLRQVKNTFIVTATLVSRAAIRGGMEADDALSLSDAYIQRCELMNSLEQIADLQYHMAADYTERVGKLRMGGMPSKLVLEVANYVERHISEPITTDAIAKALFISRSRLSVKFKQDTGENLIDFILKEKTEKAKRLLRDTDRPLAAISAYLAFSSQSHFSKIFKKYAGVTPNEYRTRR